MTISITGVMRRELLKGESPDSRAFEMSVVVSKEAFDNVCKELGYIDADRRALAFSYDKMKHALKKLVDEVDDSQLWLRHCDAFEKAQELLKELG